jgi:WXG100 family type VII secretion target
VGYIRVTPATLVSTSGKVSAAAREVQGTLSSVGGEVSALAATWDSAAHAQFTHYYAEWQRGAAMMQEAMEAIARLLNAQGGLYEHTETTNANMFRC